jgi:hypothetical protein
MECNREFFGKTISEKCIKKSQKYIDYYIKKVTQKQEKKYTFKVIENERYDFIHGIKELVLSEGDEKLIFKRAVMIVYSGSDTASSRSCQIIAESIASEGYKVYIFDAAKDKISSAGKILNYFEKMKRKNKIVLENLPTLGKFFIKSELKNAMKIEKSFLNSEIAKIMSDTFLDIPLEMPVIACDPMLATACRAAGVSRVYNLINDTDIFGENLSEKAVNIVQVLSSYLKYRTIDKGVKISEESVMETGYIIDNSSFENIDFDCNKRFERIKNKERKRIFVDFENIENYQVDKICEALLKSVNYGETELYLNYGDKNGIRRKILKKYSEHTKNIETENKFIKYEEIEKLNSEDNRMLCFGESDKFINSSIINELMRNCDFAICGYGSIISAPIPKIVFGNKIESKIENRDITLCATTNEALKDIINLMINEEHILKVMIKNVIKSKRIGMYNGIVNLTEKIFD